MERKEIKRNMKSKYFDMKVKQVELNKLIWEKVRSNKFVLGGNEVKKKEVIMNSRKMRGNLKLFCSNLTLKKPLKQDPVYSRTNASLSRIRSTSKRKNSLNKTLETTNLPLSLINKFTQPSQNKTNLEDIKSILNQNPFQNIPEDITNKKILSRQERLIARQAFYSKHSKQNSQSISHNNSINPQMHKRVNKNLSI
mmetsp:Transcript_25154/g.22290  ORF Transcript_25154/g.22290 Transcript_25154/m.22290 type:complete len:196 (-) Transcript_25154:496-1083(-)